MHYVMVSPTEAGGTSEFAFTYHYHEPLAVGQLVEVPFGRRTSLGVVTGASTKPEFTTKPISSLLDIVLPTHIVALGVWLHEYYLASPAAVWQTMLPAGITRKRRGAKPTADTFAIEHHEVTLTKEQAAGLATIRQNKHRTHLLHGVTGSGKTELYLDLAREAIENSQSVIILVPEIALAPQLEARFRAVFGDIVVAQHSRQTEAQRHQAWVKAFEAREPRIIIGPRSSLFLPLAKVGLIVVDEAHETSYKQEQAPRYQAATTAGKLSQLTEARLILGSATPSLETRYLATKGLIGYVRLAQRPDGLPMPKARIIDLRDKDLLSQSRFISTPLLDSLKVTLAEKRQSLLFINRRGSASSQICADCGTVNLCPNCELPLTFHADQMKLICHYCNFQRSPQATCESCGSSGLRYLGGGTKRIESEITRLLPQARLARLDKDSATPAYIQEVHKGLQDHSIDILIGTQMIAKGLDLPNLDLVGVISADTMLHLPDYTAAERTFQLINQVSGRAGRRQRQGEVIIQSYTPEHPAIVAAATHLEEPFIATELETRRMLGYPPFSHLLKLSCSMSTQSKTHAKAEELAETIRKITGVTVLGPAPSFLEQTEKAFHWQLIIKSPVRARLIEIARSAPSGWTIDLDPGNLL
jgi:primosomal protein N' (replication factor Y) (superfamily II helicase)